MSVRIEPSPSFIAAPGVDLWRRQLFWRGGQPTRDTLEFFYERVNPGGVIVCDDYGSVLCPGARKAMDELMDDKPESLFHIPTGQSLVVKK